MKSNIYKFSIPLDWQLINSISKIDRFDASWTSLEKKEGKNLKELKSIATVRSVGASTRIEGSTMSNDEVKVLIDKLNVANLEQRDEQEVAGYFQTMDIITESYADIDINESQIKSLHNLLMKFSKKDSWHKGGYKQLSNEVEATLADGRKQTIFKTSAPGVETDDLMRQLIDWYYADKETHPLVKCAIFTYEFLSIHPFQDGNGRLSRLISNLLLLKHGYVWVQYVSFEHEIENRKGEYYRTLMACQQQRPNEDVLSWVTFFLDALSNIQTLLLEKLTVKNEGVIASPKNKQVYIFIENNPGCSSSNIASKLNIALPSVKRILSNMQSEGLILKHGNGPGTNYSIA